MTLPSDYRGRILHVVIGKPEDDSSLRYKTQVLAMQGASASLPRKES